MGVNPAEEQASRMEASSDGNKSENNVGEQGPPRVDNSEDKDEDK